MNEQKYKKGDLVMIAKDLGDGMSHFTSDCEAIVMYTYASEYGGDDVESYGLYIKGKGQTAWYKEHQLTLIKSSQHELLNQWKDDKKKEIEKHSNVDWIFKNGKEVASRPHGASIQTLASMLGCDNLWGSRGEGIIWEDNARATMSHATSFLLKGDFDGYKQHCKDYLAKQQ